MIIDSLGNFKFYSSLHPLFAEAEQFLQTTDLVSLPVGKHVVGSNGMYAVVMEYMTRSVKDSCLECHRKFIDVQIVVVGIERMGWWDKNRSTALSYDPEKDFEKMAGPEMFFEATSGMFAIFFPDDVHMPQVMDVSGPAAVKKVVVKIPV